MSKQMCENTITHRDKGSERKQQSNQTRPLGGSDFKRTHRRPFRPRVASEHFGSQTPKPAWIDHSE